MKILQAHNFYKQAGGEDSVVAAERAMLEEHGNVIIPFYKSNDDISRERKTEDGNQQSGGRLLSVISLLRVSVQTIWNHQTYREFRAILKRERPDVVHCHNTFPLISPSIYWACAKEKVPVVQTLHNYRLLCLNAFLFRKNGRSLKDKAACGLVKNVQIAKKRGPASANSTFNDFNDFNERHGAICELCVKRKLKIPGVRYRCYRDSRAGSLVVALMLFVHKLIGTWSKKVTAYITLTEFQKHKMISGGIPADKIWVKPNFIQTLEDGDQRSETSLTTINDQLTNEIKHAYALFVGRLSPEKGCDVLIRAWTLFHKKLSANSSELMTGKQPHLIIVGDGPEREVLESLAISNPQSATIHFLGRKSKNEVITLMRQSRFLVLPSVWYEGFPMTIVEAFSDGLPVVASDIGSMTSVIESRRDGLLFRHGDPGDLSEKMAWMIRHPAECAAMGKIARQEYEKLYNSEANYKLLMNIYNQVVRGANLHEEKNEADQI